MKNIPGRRKFVKSSLLGLGGASIPSILQAETKTVGADSPGNHTQKALNIVCIGGHPGDPEFGCGGTLARYSMAGSKVTLLYLTRGEAYDPRQSFAQAAAARTKEAEASCKILNAIPVFIGQIDGNTELNKQRNDEATKIILAQQPDIVFTQWPVDSHPDHQVAGLLALTAWVQSGKKFQLYFYEVNTGSETMGFTPTDYVDITAVREIKKSALMAHKTQSPGEVYDSFFRTMEEFRGLEAGVKAAEAFVYFKPGDKKTIIEGLDGQP